MILANHGIISSSGGVLDADADALAFITAASITDTTQQTAINTLVNNLKSYGIWSKMRAIYPFVGGTATSHKWNLKDTRDLDAAYRLVFNGGWTHSVNGALPNGTNAYADSFLNATSIQSSNHLFFYSRTQTVDLINSCEIGVSDLVNNYFNQLRINVNYVSGNVSAVVSFTNTTDARGGWLSTKRASNDRESYLNGSTQTTLTTNDTSSNPNFNIYIGARNQPNSSPVVAFYSSKECAFASIGEGLTDTEAANFYTAVQNFNTLLSRQV
jgi:hypothetical protein